MVFMADEVVISLNNVSKCFKRYAKPIDRLKEVLFPTFNYSDDFWALRDINLEIPKGQTVGVIGRNGSGKSTLLQIIAKTLTATTGEVNVQGRVSALLELGSGFNPEFTGRQNVFFNGSLLGLNQKEVEDKFDEIAGFADIGDFIDQPVKTYSSGMFVRLAFAVAVNVNPDILIVDEALAVGDIYFQQKCFHRLMKLRDNGTTFLLVSHDTSAVHRLCSLGVLIDSGRIDLIAKTRKVIDLYEINLIQDLNQNFNNELSDKSKHSSYEIKQDNDLSVNQDGVTTDSSSIYNPLTVNTELTALESASAKVLFTKILDTNNQEIPLIISEQLIKLHIGVLFFQSFDDPLIGFQLRDRTGLIIFQTNTFMMGQAIGEVTPNTLVEVYFNFSVPLSDGEYTITLGVANKGVGQWSFEEAILRIYNVCILKVTQNHDSSIWFGLVNLLPTVSIEKNTMEKLNYIKNNATD